MRWRAPPPVFPVPRRSWDAFDVAASLFVVAVAVHAGWLLVHGVEAGHERLAIVWLCVQLGAVALALYFWADRSTASRHALRAAAIGDLLLLGIGLMFPAVIVQIARLLTTHPSAYL